MNKRRPTLKDGKFYNNEEETVFVDLKEVIIHYSLNILNWSYYYSSGKNNNGLPFCLLGKALLRSQEQSLKDDLIITPMGHASVLLSYYGKNILFDPVFGASSFFFNRYLDSIYPEALPKIDLVIFSHNHPDHYNKKDLESLLRCFPAVKIIAPTKFIDFLEKENITVFTYELNWWDEISFFDHLITIRALPAIHWSQSTLFNKNETLWASWAINFGDVTFFFAGDTAYNSHFKEIKEYLGRIDIACIPIAPYDPPSLQRDSHMSTEESYQAFLDLGKPIFIPIHWGVFAYGEEPLKEPIERIIKLFLYNNESNLLQATTIYHPYIYKNIKNKE